jgi:adenine-specific DNA-methyltransferase
MIYGERTNGGEHGSVMTKKEVSEFMLDLLGYQRGADLSEIKILEPAAGEGVFIQAAIERLFQSSKLLNFSFEDALKNIKAVEIDPKKATLLKERIHHILTEHGINNANITNDLVYEGDFLESHFDKFDIIVGNPPYVRYDNIPKKLQKRYKKSFNTFRDRSDLYIPFFEKGLNLLKENGKLCYVCSNRWMKSQYGQKLREVISRSYGIPVIVNIEEADAFEEKVNAYPSIALITRKQETKIHYFETNNLLDLPKIMQVLSGENKVNGLKQFIIQKPRDHKWILHPDILKIQDSNFTTFEEQGFSIGIGVATGADSVFIGKQLPEHVEKEVILPLISGKDIVDGSIKWRGNYVINPYNAESGKLVNLADYPKLKSYLENHRAKLVKRHTAKKYPTQWYKTIDKIDSKLTKKPKLILPDMKSSPYIILDEGKYYPHHNVYYILNHEKRNLEILGSLLMSEFVTKQLKTISNSMNGGYSRWQAQNLRKIVIPQIQNISEKEQEELLTAFEGKDLNKINKIVNAMTIENSKIKTQTSSHHKIEENRLKTPEIAPF